MTDLFCITDFWYPKIGGMERSIENLCSNFSANIRPHILTTEVDRIPDEKKFSFDVQYLAADNGSGYYENALDYIHSFSGPKVVHVFGFSYFWPESQVSFIRQVAGLNNTAVVMKIPTSGDATKYLTTTHAELPEHIHCFIALTHDIQSELIRCGIQKENIRSVPNGVSTHRFNAVAAEEKIKIRKSLDLPENRILLGFAGRFEKRKRLDLLVEAIRLVPEEKRPCLLLAGYSDKTFNTAVDITNWLDNDVRWYKPDHTIQVFYQSLDIYITASEAEGMSNSILEAMSCGLPVIASDIPGHRELIHHDENGLLFHPGDAGDLAYCIQRLINKVEKAQIDPMKERSREIISEKYDQNIVSAGYELLYSTLLNTIKESYE